MSSYYFVAAAMPSLKVGDAADITLREYFETLQINLAEGDLEYLVRLRLFYDIQNIRAYWREHTLDPAGNFDRNELEEALIGREGFPEYVYAFLDRYPQLPERLRFFPSLIASYFHQELDSLPPFIRAYFAFERQLRLVLLGLRAKHMHRDLLLELQHEDPFDETVAQLLLQKDAKSYVPPEAFEELSQIFEKFYDTPLALQRALSEYRFAKIDEILGVDFFSINRVLGNLLQLFIVERWFRLDEQRGRAIVDTIIKS